MLKSIQEDEKKYEATLIAADLKLCKRMPFFSNFYMGMETRLSDKDISFTNGRAITISKPFLDRFPRTGAIFIKFHETEHCYLKHLERFQMYSNQPDQWWLYNILADYIIWLHAEETINEIMDKAEFKKMGEEGVSQSTLEKFLGSCLKKEWKDAYAKSGLAFTDVDGSFKFLRKYIIPGSGTGKMGGQSEPGGNGEYTEEIGQEIEGKINESIVSSKTSGRGGSRLMEELDKLWNCREIKWWKLIAREIASQIKGELTFNRPNKRGLALGDMIIPTRAKKDTARVLIAIDVSGSVGSKALGKFFGEIDNLLAKDQLYVKLVTFDDGIHNTYEITNSQELRAIKMIEGRGGTSFKAPLELAAKEKFRNVVIMTDGYGDWDDCETPCGKNVWWICTSDQIAPQRLGKTYPIKNDVD